MPDSGLHDNAAHHCVTRRDFEAGMQVLFPGLDSLAVLELWRMCSGFQCADGRHQARSSHKIVPGCGEGTVEAATVSFAAFMEVFGQGRHLDPLGPGKYNPNLDSVRAVSPRYSMPRAPLERQPATPHAEDEPWQTPRRPRSKRGTATSGPRGRRMQRTVMDEQADAEESSVS